MRYITFLSDLVQSCDDNDDDNYGGAGEGRGSSGRRGKVQEKVIVRCRVAGELSVILDDRWAMMLMKQMTGDGETAVPR